MKLEVLINDVSDQQNIVGVKNHNLKLLEDLFGCKIAIRGNEVYADCDEHTGYLLDEILIMLTKISKEGYQIKLIPHSEYLEPNGVLTKLPKCVKGIEYTIETTKDDIVESYKYVKLV